MKLGKGLVVSAVILVFILMVLFVNNPAMTGYAVADEVNLAIDNANLRFNQLNAEHLDFLNIFGINLDASRLDEFKGRLSILMPDDEESARQLQLELAAFLEPLPMKVTKKGSFKDTQLLELNDIKSSYTLNSEEELYRYQNKASVTFELAAYDVEFNSGAMSTYSIIKKSISANELLSDVSLYEILPLDANLVNFYTPGYLIEGNSAKYEFSSLTDTIIVYGIRQDVSSDEAYGLKTILVPKMITTEPGIQTSYACGDGNCISPVEDEITCPEDCKPTKKNLPWLYMGILIVILVLGILYLNFYRGRADFRRLFRGKSPFASEADLSSVKRFIMDAIKKGTSLTDISKALLNKGWAKKQIEYAFEDARWELKKVLLEITPNVNTADTSSAEAYIKKCLAVGIDELKIKAALFSKGWKPEQIDAALKNAKKTKA